jgi:hypothetical protein
LGLIDLDRASSGSVEDLARLGAIEGDSENLILRVAATKRSHWLHASALISYTAQIVVSGMARLEQGVALQHQLPFLDSDNGKCHDPHSEIRRKLASLNLTLGLR